MFDTLRHRPAEVGLHLATVGTALAAAALPGPSFETPKLVLLLLAVALSAWRSGERPSVAPLPLIIGCCALLPAALAALGLGLAPDLALWGGPERQQGLIIDIALLLLMLNAAPLLSVHQVRRRWCRGISMVLLISAVIALWQLLGGLHWWLPLADSSRASASFGNPTQAAAWWLLAWPAALSLLGSAQRSDRWLGTVALVAAALCLLASGSRAVYPALAVALALLLARGAALRWVLLGAPAVALLLVALTLSWRPDSTVVRSDLLRAGLAVVADPPVLVDAHGNPDGLAGWRWLIGYGPDAIDPVLASRLPEGPAQQARPDRAHQQIIDLYLSRGLLGVLAGLAVLVWLALRWRDLDASNDLAARLPFVALAGWLVAMQLGFALTADKSLAVLWLALLAAPRPGGGFIGDGSNVRAAFAAALLAPALLMSIQRTPPAAIVRHFDLGQQAYVDGLEERKPVSALRQLAEAERRFALAQRLDPYQGELALARVTAAVAIARRTTAAQRVLCALEHQWLIIEQDPITAERAVAAKAQWELIGGCASAAGRAQGPGPRAQI